MEKEVIISNDLSEIAHVTNFIKDLGDSLQLSSDDVMSFSLALEEAIVNVIKYAYPKGGDYEVRVRINISSQEFTFAIVDNGVSFNPTFSVDLYEGKLESHTQEQHFFDSLGIRLIRQIMDEVSYQSVNGQNILTLKKRMDIELKPEKTMKINVCKIEGITIITIEGRLDTVNAREFDLIIQPIQNDSTPNIIINCENFTYISSSGIRSFILLQKGVVKNKGLVVLEAMRPEIRKIFDMTGCSSLFCIR